MDIRQEMKLHGMRWTPERQAILEVMQGEGRHLDAGEIESLVKERFGRQVSLATVYRTLLVLVQAALVRPVPRDAGGRGRYELVGGRPHHDHLVCAQCNRMVEFREDDIERIQQDIASRHGFTLTGHHHVLLGLCGSCQEEIG